eukprot:3988259-Prymnesium_polylepis.2
MGAVLFGRATCVTHAATHRRRVSFQVSVIFEYNTRQKAAPPPSASHAHDGVSHPPIEHPRARPEAIGLAHCAARPDSPRAAAKTPELVTECDVTRCSPALRIEAVTAASRCGLRPSCSTRMMSNAPGSTVWSTNSSAPSTSNDKKVARSRPHRVIRAASGAQGTAATGAAATPSVRAARRSQE